MYVGIALFILAIAAVCAAIWHRHRQRKREAKYKERRKETDAIRRRDVADKEFEREFHAILFRLRSVAYKVSRSLELRNKPCHCCHRSGDQYADISFNRWTTPKAVPGTRHVPRMRALQRVQACLHCCALKGIYQKEGLLVILEELEREQDPVMACDRAIIEIDDEMLRLSGRRDALVLEKAGHVTDQPAISQRAACRKTLYPIEPETYQSQPPPSRNPSSAPPPPASEQRFVRHGR